MHCTRLIALFLVLLGSAQAQKGKPSTFEFIEFPGALSTQARGINKAGDIAGNYSTETATKGFVRSAAGTFTTIDVPGSAGTRAWGISDTGQVVGQFFSGELYAESQGFLYHNGQYTTINYPGAGYTFPTGVSVAGVTGTFYGGSQIGGYHGFLYSNGQWTQLDVPGAVLTFAWGIAPNGQIVGSWDDAAGGARHGFIYTAGSYQTIDFPRPGTYATELYGINGVGSILGAVSNGGCDYEPFIYSRLGKYAMLDLPGSFITGINDAGYVVGIFGTGNRGFVAKASSFTIR